MSQRVLWRLLGAFISVPALLSAGTAIAGTAIAAPASAVPAAVADPVYGCPAQGTTRLPYPDDAHKVVNCTNGVATITACPNSRYWNPRLQICGDLSAVQPYETRTATGTARLNLVPLQVLGLNARLTWQDGRPLGGATITFTTTRGSTLCTAHTDGNGYAACDSAPGVTAPVNTLLNGFEAIYKGVPTLRASQGHGNVTL
ncbi:chitin binding peritrophin-A domain-containing protein [Streptomyces sp. NPDC050610]|uniref:chitin binding peritrophin-A domain-containing protein n=1 Tax=Streptomyces sp. NPDC050610 TaxID=3157097 RepID=UPI0034134085